MSESDNTDGLSPFERRMRERIAKRKAEEAASQPQTETFADDLVPEDEKVITEEGKAVDNAVEGIDIIDAYNRYIGKSKVTVRKGQRESIMISCPWPWHLDKNPSAWINLDKQAFMCRKCGRGGDAHDMAAIAKGLNVDTYKTDGTFHKLREDMAADFGHISIRVPGGAVITATVEEDEPEVSPEVAPDEPAPSNVTALRVGDELDAEEDIVLIPKLDWDFLIEPDTFLDEYMKATRVDDVPEEYHLFHAFAALGLALGRDVTLFDAVPVYGNLFICTLGKSGSGKSKAKYHLDRLLEKALPYKHDDPNSKGTKRIEAPASAEVLIYQFQKPVPDPADPKKIAYNAPVRGLIEFNELSSLVGRSARLGSVIKPTLMSFYDMQKKVSTSSMTHGSKEAEEPFACAITSSQPKALKSLIGTADDASGFLNRWVFVLGTPKKKFAVGGAMVDTTPAVAPLSDILGWASTFRTSDQLQWSQEALMTYTDFFYRHIEVDRKLADNDMITRIDLLIKKLILLFAANEKRYEVDKRSVDRAIAMYDYLIASYQIPADSMNGSIYGEIQQAVMNLAEKQFKRNGKGVTAAELTRALWRRNYNATQIKGVLDALTTLGLLELVTTKVGDKGRPTVRYRYVDA